MGNVHLLVAVLAALVLPAAAFCPSMCQCDDGSLEAACSGARLDSVPILLNPSLRSLHLAHNRIASLRQSVSFYGELRQLDLSHNSLHSLGLYHFQPLGYLEHLNVSNNLISAVEAESFSGLGALAVLDLSANRLTRLTSGLFMELVQLNELILSSNKIQTVAEGAFDGLPNLRTLRLDDNNLAHVPALSALSGSLVALHLSKNLIESLDDGAFRPLRVLRVLRLNDNALVRIDPHAFDALDSLQALDLSFNRLDGALESFAEASDALAFASLAHLDLSGNMWRALPAAFLSALSRLESLNVSYMEYLRHIDPDAFRTAGDNASALPLTQLVVTNNALLNHLPRRVLHGLEERLIRLDLSGNAFETLDLSGSDWPNLRYLNVAYNPLECNCSLLWLWRKLADQRDSLPAFVNQSIDLMNVTCNGPPPFAGLLLSQLKVSDLNCALVPVSLIIVLVVVWSAVSVGLAAAFIYWRRRSKHRLEGRLVMIKSTKPIVDHPYQQHQMSPVLNGQLKANYPFYSDTVNGGVHLPATRSVSPGSTLMTNQHYGFQHGYQQPVYQQPFAHQYPQHQLTVSVRDEYTYHSHGTARRVPVTIV